MKKALSIVVVAIIVFSSFETLTPQVMGWAGWVIVAEGVHAKMTRDALDGLGFSALDIELIAAFADEVDLTLGHCSYANHRVSEYQILFQEYGGDPCNQSGAESWARDLISSARRSYAAGNIAEGRFYLGYAIHFIQDAACPPHVFPFKEDQPSPHTLFEVYTLNWYGAIGNDWQSEVKNAPILEIIGPTHLRDKVKWAADLVHSLSCSYVSQNGTVYGNPPVTGWYMSDEDIGFSMAIAASLVKGATKWALSGTWPSDVAVTKSGPDAVSPGEELTFSIEYSNRDEGVARNVILRDFLSQEVEVKSASAGGIYDAATHSVSWNIGDLKSYSRGEVTITVSVPSAVPVGTTLENIAEITTTSLEYPHGNNRDVKSTIVALADVTVAKYGQDNVVQGDKLTYRIDYFNMGTTAKNVVLKDFLPSETSFFSASGGGIYDSASNCVTWYLGTLPSYFSGSVSVTILVPSSVPVSTVLKNTAKITTTSHESKNDNNQFVTSTIVLARPTTILITPIEGYINGSPILRGWAPVTFTCLGNSSVIGVDINIHFDDGGPDIMKLMTKLSGTYDWTLTYTFAGRGGWGIVTFTVHYPTGDQIITRRIFVRTRLYDPSGHVYDALTGERIQGVTVTLLRFDVALNQFVVVLSDDPGIYPNANPQVTDEIGEYGWMVSSGIYMVKAEKQGYTSNFALVSVPPPATDVNIPLMPADMTPPVTSISFEEPSYVDSLDNTHLTSATLVRLMAEDNPDGSGVAFTVYKIHNATYDSGWITCTEPFYLIGLSDGAYEIGYNSTDYAGNVEPTNTATVILDNTGPLVAIVNPPSGRALQDGVTFIISAIDAASGVSSVNFTIREANGGEGIPLGFEDIPATYNATTGKWTLFFDTLQLPDGYYIVLVKAKDNLGNIGPTIIVPYSIRNWAVIGLLPASETNKAGRTMPVKFALRVAASVDPNQPFVYNEDLTIKIFATNDPSNILQTSTYGDTARDYRINTVNELYITNFQTLKTPKTYVVEIYRNEMLIGTFEFETVK